MVATKVHFPAQLVPWTSTTPVYVYRDKKRGAQTQITACLFSLGLFSTAYLCHLSELICEPTRPWSADRMTTSDRTNHRMETTVFHRSIQWKCTPLNGVAQVVNQSNLNVRQVFTIAALWRCSTRTGSAPTHPANFSPLTCNSFPTCFFFFAHAHGFAPEEFSVYTAPPDFPST